MMNNMTYNDFDDYSNSPFSIPNNLCMTVKNENFFPLSQWIKDNNNNSNEEGEHTMFDSMFSNSNLFGKIAPGMCRLTMNGNIAVKTSSGYKSYNVKTGRLVNCEQFVFNIGEEFFFVIPTNKVQKGDIILVNKKPRCVIETNKNTITVINYENSTVDTIIPERHVFMGNVYFYGKIVSMFGNIAGSGKNGINKMMKFMMMSEMMKGMNGNNSSNSNMSSILPFMLMNGNMENMFEGMFDFSEDDTDESSEDETGEDIVNISDEASKISANGLVAKK